MQGLGLPRDQSETDAVKTHMPQLKVQASQQFLKPLPIMFALPFAFPCPGGPAEDHYRMGCVCVNGPLAPPACPEKGTKISISTESFHFVLSI